MLINQSCTRAEMKRFQSDWDGVRRGGGKGSHQNGSLFGYWILRNWLLARKIRRPLHAWAWSQGKLGCWPAVCSISHPAEFNVQWRIACQCRITKASTTGPRVGRHSQSESIWRSICLWLKINAMARACIRRLYFKASAILIDDTKDYFTVRVQGLL